MNWLSHCLEDCWKNDNRDFFVMTREGNRSFLVQRRSNINSHFISLEEYGGGGKRGSIFIPEEGGDGWQQLAAPYKEAERRGPPKGGVSQRHHCLRCGHSHTRRRWLSRNQHHD